MRLSRVGGRDDNPACLSCAGSRFPADSISHAVRLYFRFPLSLRTVDELQAARGTIVSYETGRSSSARASQTRSGVGCLPPVTSGT